MSEQFEGSWQWPYRARKAHWFFNTAKKSLCGEHEHPKFLPLPDWDDTNSENCVTCLRKLEKLKTQLGILKNAKT